MTPTGLTPELTALDLLSGDAQTFIGKVWASRVHIHASTGDDLVGLFTLDDVDRLLTGSAIRTPAVRLAKDGSVLPSSRFTRSASLAGVPLTGLVDARKVLRLFDDGATVVLQGLQRYWPPLARLVRELELELGHPCQANAYLTPPGSQGFALHKDTHDVFTFQTHGSKVWEVHDGGEAREVTMTPGLSMYLPTGTPHAARTQQTTSLHVTVGINQVTWRHVVERVLPDVLDAAELGDHLPAGYHLDPRAFADQLAPRLARAAAALSELDPGHVAAQETERFFTTRPPSVAGGLADRVALAELTDDTLLRRRPGSVFVLRLGGERLRVLLGDRELLVPPRLHDALLALQDLPTLRPADLAPWLDQQSRLVLVRRLVVEGLLEVAG